ncbi:MAG: penicillin-binding transpeptidase domain-containing protein [Defluviitaleaceae bacterium]|nr:penicillin-binding transpeptidase domain-containing protein [Defluviitaleaceae bacterium]MCL2835540.1 penicillin-binding transpeptidase domain-containing protein [Defluviitaleaceae bacterium]
MKEILSKIKSLLTNRLIVLLVILTAMFIILATRLYDLQIVHGHEYQTVRRQFTNERVISAPRGEIFDRNGQPLAINRTTAMVKMDPNVRVHGNNHALINENLLSFIRLMDRYGEVIEDELRISESQPREFLFGGSRSREELWKRDMNLPLDISAQDAYDRLVARFRIPVDDMTPREARLVLSMRQSLLRQQWHRNPITVVLSVSPAAQAALEERNQEFPGFYIDIDYLREYPEGMYVSHIIGYIRRINSDQLERNRVFGYIEDDLFGQEGVESAFELFLRGERGSVTIETDSAGRRIGILDTNPAIAGDNVYLTLDINLQREIYHIIERRLTEIIIGKLTSNPRRERARPEDHIPVRDLLVSMIKSNNISIGAIMTAGEENLAWPIRAYVENNSDFDIASETYQRELRDFVADAVDKGRITENQLLLAMYEQGLVAPTDAELERMKRGNQQTLAFIVRMLNEGYITPAMTNVHPSTASVVVLDVDTGAVLASVSYPSYDNNRLVNNFDNNYWARLMNDPARPMFNRAFQELRAVGSTFKMLTTVAVLENEVVRPNTRIFDEFTFTSAGLPHARCNTRHGSVNAEEAIMVSCNYYYYETSFRLGNSRSGNMLEGIWKLNEYMSYFGLGHPTGVEIFCEFDRLFERLPHGLLPISSPEYRLHRGRGGWSDGETIRTAIGQSENALTCAVMAKYTATIASGGVRYEMHFLSHVEAYDGSLVSRRTPVIEDIVPMSESTLNTVRRGMLGVTANSRGTAHRVFRDLPIQVAGKTGTAQEEGWPNHMSFSAFAPYDDPAIALYVLVPGGYRSSSDNPAAVVARDVIEAYFKLDAEPQRPVKDNTLVMR